VTCFVNVRKQVYFFLLVFARLPPLRGFNDALDNLPNRFEFLPRSICGAKTITDMRCRLLPDLNKQLEDNL
jgi:hypothetical protein